MDQLTTDTGRTLTPNVHHLYFAAVREFVNNSRAKQETKYVELFC